MNVKSIQLIITVNVETQLYALLEACSSSQPGSKDLSKRWSIKNIEFSKISQKVSNANYLVL